MVGGLGPDPPGPTSGILSQTLQDFGKVGNDTFNVASTVFVNGRPIDDFDQQRL